MCIFVIANKENMIPSKFKVVMKKYNTIFTNLTGVECHVSVTKKYISVYYEGIDSKVEDLLRDFFTCKNMRGDVHRDVELGDTVCYFFI